ncbi:hypothetical protein ACIA8K_19525 [Catenuloplanes sp. NPDC051500]|uniref:hypothetical protein n=1 Tax=Catenuloplanes sp. NPDC051500 TaxID=3363959 RepID=UPI0037980912
MKNVFKSLALVAGLAAMALPGTAHAAGPGESWSLFRNAGLNACVDAAPMNSTVVTDCDGSRSQRWLLENLGERTGEFAVFRIRKNDWECAELAGDWGHARLRISPCDLHAPNQLFQVTQADGAFGNLHLHSQEHKQLLKAYQRGTAPFTSATLEWPGDAAVWTFRPLG